MATLKAKNPKELQQALRNSGARDTILVTGEFGAVGLKGVRPEGGVTIRAAKPGAAHFESIVLSNCANLTFEGLRFWPNAPIPPSRGNRYLITAYPNTSAIEVANCIFRGRVDSDDFSTWSLTDWRQFKVGAVLLRGPRSVIRNCAAVGVYFGFGVSGRSSEIFENRVFGFSGDGLRVTEDNCVVIGNRVTDAMQIDRNHSDGLQAFKPKGLLNGLVVKDNVLIEWTVRPDNPLRAKMQGIGLHNGPYANVVMRDNSIACSTPNGIRLNAVRGLEVTGNRVRNVDGKRGKHPWIWVQRCSGRVVVTDNEAENFNLQREAVVGGNSEPNYAVSY
ncbi:hypothetical protein DEA8626_02332 [Defluviimonas aquaemixtae]|uniref:Uncharacterized protein n=1 Tax=Albidovulum aquaemixtae TaxID=1542388 RepID=A0A2R8B875_9RHOB|nr:right-handed parallel beta-helix repeat-containing protein [Defluviimonas aquaemixtae]SPH18788.1 hypothetical protein DEA8626_02332 [Defluviimonas aquaemixtae]